MSSEKKEKKFFFVDIISSAVALVLLLVGAAVFASTDEMPVILNQIGFIGFFGHWIFSCIGCYYLARSKKRSGLWSVLGVFNIIGVLIVVLLPRIKIAST